MSKNPTKSETIRQKLSEISQMDAQYLCVRAELGELSFEDMLEEVDSIIQLARQASELSFERLPKSLNDVIQTSVSQIEGQLNSLVEFKIKDHQSPQSQRNQIRDQFRKHSGGAVEKMLPIVTYLMLSDRSLADLQAETRTQREKMESALSESLEHVSKVRTEVDEMASAARIATARSGAGSQASSFEYIANVHRNMGRVWLVVTAILAAVTAGVPIVILESPDVFKSTTNYDSIHYLATRLILVSLLYVATIWASRNHRAHRHLEVVNRHRQTALQTFRAFVEGTDTPDIQDAVLMEAARCAFGPSQTGYLGADEEMSSNRIVEIMRTALPNTKVG